MDSSGFLFIADYGNYVIRMVTASGIISTFAGTGVVGSSGDNGLAISAQFFHLAGISVDTSGNLYIADSYNNVIRRVNRNTGIITVFAGTTGYTNLGSSGDGGQAISAQLNAPNTPFVDVSGNVYISDTGNYKIRVVSPAGIITTYAGTGSSRSTGDGGAATSANFIYPIGVIADTTGNVYIADIPMPGGGWSQSKIRLVRPMLACSSGNYYDSSGTCVVCPVGTYQGSNLYQGTNLVPKSCSTCPLNTYSSTVGAAACTACPTSYVTYVVGATSASACLLVSSCE